MVEGEEDGTKECCRLLIWIRFEPGMDIDDEGRADSGKQTGLRGRG